MKLKISEMGVFDADGIEVEVGTVIEIDGDVVPANLVNKVISLGEADPLDHNGDGKKGGSLPKSAR